ncbi:MAG: DUF1993 domain-containing protein [Tardiphaga sp.]
MSFYDSVVPAYLQMLGSLSAILDKAEAHATAKKIEPEVLLGARLYPDMMPLVKQVQTACDQAMRGCARLTGNEPQSVPDTERSFAELKQRLAMATDYVKGHTAAQFEGADVRDVTFPIGGAKTTTMSGQQFFTSFNAPNFYFHVTTAHGILRHNGVEIGKRDFLGAN